MRLPRVKIDYTEHPLYSKSEYYIEKYGIGKVLDAEVLMFNINKGTLRVRLYDIDTGETLMNNHDTDISYVLDDKITIQIQKTKRV